MASSKGTRSATLAHLPTGAVIELRRQLSSSGPPHFSRQRRFDAGGHAIHQVVALYRRHELHTDRQVASPKPAGRLSAGPPYNDDGNVARSALYMATGSSTRSPRGKATVGVVGDTRTSTSRRQPRSLD